MHILLSVEGAEANITDLSAHLHSRDDYHDGGGGGGNDGLWLVKWPDRKWKDSEEKKANRKITVMVLQSRRGAAGE